MKVVAIIQARMGSTRLPGKVIRELAGKPMIIHLIERLKTCCTVDEIILATGEGDENTVLVSTAEQAGITAFAGPEEDVLARFCMAAQKAGADHVIRVTGDNPLTDPECIDRLVQKQVETGADYGCMTGLPLGTTAEIISFRALEKSCREGKQQPHREHVTVYAKENPQKFKLFSLEAPESLRAPELRLTVDTPEDFSLIGEVFKRLCKDGQIISLAEVINLLRTEPELAARNKGIVQKKPRDRTLIIRADGGIQTGMGHISRTLTLARAIAAEKPVNIIFLTGNYSPAVQKIREAGFKCETMAENCPVQEELDILTGLVGREKSNAVLIDVLDTGEKYIEQLQKLGQKVICLDNIRVPRELPDLFFNAILERDFSHMILPDTVALLSQKERHISPGVKNILVTMGGSDPACLTVKVLKALLNDSINTYCINPNGIDTNGINTNHINVKIRVVLGPAFPWEDRLQKLVESETGEFAGEIEILRDVPDMSGLMYDADIAICSAGLTMFELAALGIPCIVLSQHEEQKANADYMEEMGAVINLGIGREVDEKLLQEACRRLIEDPHRRCLLSEAARRAIDGKGTKRVVEKIVTLLYG